VEEARTIKKRVILRGKYQKPSLLRNPMLNGKMYQDLKMQKMHSKKQLFYPFDLKKFSREAESLGKVFCSTDHQEQEKPSWLRHVQPKLKELSSQYLLLT
jgi:hypothetical protein